MPAVGGSPHPPVEWAQRKDVVFLTVGVEDCKDPKFEFTEEKLHIGGHGGPDKHEFDLEIEFFKPIDTDKARRIPSDRSIQFVIPKKESGPYWPRLLKSEKKVHWVKVDFNKWKDEDDESDDEGMNWDLNDMMGKMGGYGDAKPDLDDLGDSDNEELPDLEDDKEASVDEEEKEKTLKKEHGENAHQPQPTTSGTENGHKEG